MLELVAIVLFAGALADGAFGRQLGIFEIAQNFLGALKDRLGHTGKACYLDAVAFIGAALYDFAEEDGVRMNPPKLLM